MLLPMSVAYNFFIIQLTKQPSNDFKMEETFHSEGDHLLIFSSCNLYCKFYGIHNFLFTGQSRLRKWSIIYYWPGSFCCFSMYSLQANTTLNNASLSSIFFIRRSRNLPRESQMKITVNSFQKQKSKLRWVKDLFILFVTLHNLCLFELQQVNWVHNL